MDRKIEIEEVSQEEYELYNLVIERLAKVIPELDIAITHSQDLECRHGFDMDAFKLQDAMCDIASVFAKKVAGVKFIKPEKGETKGE